MAKKKFNEEFVKVYENPSLLTKFDVEEKSHIDLDPVYGDAILQAKKVREKMKDDFKEQDKMVDEFLKASDLKEKPEFPDVENKAALKSMKLAEKYLREEDTVVPLDMSIFEITPGPNFDLEENLDEGCDEDLDECCNEQLGESYQLNESDADYVCSKDSGGIGDPGQKLTKKELREIYNNLKSFDPLVADYKSYDEWVDASVNSGYITPLHESLAMNEDYANFIGKPLKDFLKTLDHRTKVNLDYDSPALVGESGLSGLAHDVPWYVADRIIKDIQLGDDRYYKFKILTEEKKRLIEDEEKHRYKVVAADENAEELYVKDVSTLKKVNQELSNLTDDALNSMGATQVYVVRDDDKEIYFKYGNEDGTWEVDQDERDMELPAEERDTIYNHMIADLNAESTPDQRALRRMSRAGEGYVGFENDEIGFDSGVFHLHSQSQKPIEWAKKVADFYGFETSDVIERDDGYKFIDIYANGIEKDPKLVP